MAQCFSLPLYDKYIKDPSEKQGLYTYLQQLDWTNQTVRDSFQKNSDESIYVQACTEYSGPSSVSVIHIVFTYVWAFMIWKGLC